MNETNQMYMRTHFSGVGSEVEGRAEEARLTSSSFLTAGRYSLIGSYCITYTEHKNKLYNIGITGNIYEYYVQSIRINCII